MTKNLEITITDGGEIQMLAPDDLDLTEFGKPFVRRASHIEYNNDRGAWTVRLANCDLLGHFATRAEAIEAEVEYLNRKIDDGTIEEVF